MRRLTFPSFSYSGLVVAALPFAIACSTDEGSSDTSEDDTATCTVLEGPAGPCQTCTSAGWVAGAPDSASCEYLGVPFAEPPVGELRFAAPVAAEPWEGVLAATAFAPACMQGQDLSLSDVKSEDCLYLNVWTPAVAPAAPLPVMVFVHGGGYFGGATKPHRGLDLAESGPVVVVSMAYRLGPLGFFAHSELDLERADRPSGSDGIRDQQLALEWVKANVARFHGDPTNVTLFGESAGSSSVGVHHVSPGSEGLVSRFLMESGVSTSGVDNGIEPVARDTMYALTGRMSDELCAGVGAGGVMTCLRGLPAEQIMGWTSSSLSGEPNWVPVIEGEGGVLPAHPDELIAAGRYNPGEVLVGTNRNEFGLFQAGRGATTTVAAFRAMVEESYDPAFTARILAEYAPASDADASAAQVTLMTDTMFRCATRSFARAVTAQGESVYLYSFEQGNAIHSDELGYVFGPGFYGLDLASPLPALSEIIQSYWVSFARNGDPSAQDLPAWPRYDLAADSHVVLRDPVSTGTGLQSDACDLWDEYLAATE